MSRTFNPTFVSADLFDSKRKTYARAPVWKGSTFAAITWSPYFPGHENPKYARFEMKLEFRRRVAAIYDARAPRADRARGKTWPLIGNVMEFLEATFDRLDAETGELTPMRDTIADDTGMCSRTVLRVTQFLKAHNLLDWEKRAKRVRIGEFDAVQNSNSYRWHLWGWKPGDPTKANDPRLRRSSFAASVASVAMWTRRATQGARAALVAALGVEGAAAAIAAGDAPRALLPVSSAVLGSPIARNARRNE